MSTQRIISLTKDSVVPVSVGLLFLLVAGVWTLAMRVAEWEHQMNSFEHSLGLLWTYPMERESWAEFREKNPSVSIPNISAIKSSNDPVN